MSMRQFDWRTLATQHDARVAAIGNEQIGADDDRYGCRRAAIDSARRRRAGALQKAPRNAAKRARRRRLEARRERLIAQQGAHQLRARIARR